MLKFPRKKCKVFVQIAYLRTFLKLLTKFVVFQKSRGTGDSGSDFVAAPEAAKSDTSFRILTFLCFASFSKFLRNSKNTRHRRFPVRFCCRPGGGKKRHILYDFNIFIFFIFFIFFANFKKHKVAEIPGPILVPSRRRQKVTHPI